MPVKLLAAFRPTHEWILEPGDVLYLPPGVAHEGVAIGECITCSVGFRAPAWQELVAPWFEWLEERTQVKGALRDPQLRPTRAPARLPRGLVEDAFAKLGRLRPTRDDAAGMLLRTLTEPKPQIVFAGRRRSTVAAFHKRATRRGVALDLRSRILYSSRLYAINGELHRSAGASSFAPSLADRRALPGSDLALLDPAEIELLHEWYVAGWLHLQAP
jgi:50S ribosomal protein L16 3-hydroxylase